MNKIKYLLGLQVLIISCIANAQTLTYGYDDVGNRKRRAITVGGGGQRNLNIYN